MSYVCQILGIFREVGAQNDVLPLLGAGYQFRRHLFDNAVGIATENKSRWNRTAASLAFAADDIKYNLDTLLRVTRLLSTVFCIEEKSDKSSELKFEPWEPIVRTCQGFDRLVRGLCIIRDSLFILTAVAWREKLGTEVAEFEADATQPEGRYFFVKGFGEAWERASDCA